MHGMRHRVCARYLVTLAGAIGALALPAAAQAGGSSPLHIDPNSPVAKAYALPISAARGAPPESGRSGAIFGAGISTAASAPAPSSDCRAGSGSGHDGGAHLHDHGEWRRHPGGLDRDRARAAASGSCGW